MIPPGRTIPPGKVYFLHAPAARKVKIGTSTNLPVRLDFLKSWCPVPLRLIATTPGGRVCEAHVHRTLAKHRSHGEWFHDEPEVIAFAKSVRAAQSIPGCPDEVPKERGKGRLGEILSEAGIAPAEAAEAMGVQLQTIRMWTDLRVPEPRIPVLLEWLNHRGLALKTADLFGERVAA